MSNKDKAVMLGWSGRWSDGAIGWRTSTFVIDRRPHEGLEPEQVVGAPNCDNTFERVRITVEVVRRKDGRRITKRVKPK